MSVGRFAADRHGATRDWQLLDRHAAQSGSTLADLARRHLEPLLKRLRQSAG